MKKKVIHAFILTALVLGVLLIPVSAEDKDENPTVIKGSIVAGGQVVNEQNRSSKFYEYRDVPRGFIIDRLNLDILKGNRYLHLTAAKVQQADQSYSVGIGSYGKFKLDLALDQTPHRFSFFGATPYIENSSGVFTLPDVIQSAAQTLVGDGSNNANAYMSAARALISNYLTGAHPINLGLQRKKGTLNFTYIQSVPLSFNLKASLESREGNRPIGAPLGFSNLIELPEPIHFQTTNLDASVEYSKKWGTVQAGYAASIFDNDTSVMVWDNPYRITDQSYSSAYVSGNGSALGQTSLWPSNNAQRFYVHGSFNPMKATRITAAVSYGIWDQNQKLLPFTVNTTVPGSSPNAVNALSPPRSTAMAKANVTSLDFTLNSRLHKKIYLTTGFRYYDFANKIEELDVPTGYARVDQVWEDIPLAVEPYSFARSRLFANLSFHLLKNTSLQVGYSLATITRHEGNAEEEKNKNNEGTFKVSVDSNPLDWLTVRVSYLNADRDWSLDSTAVAYFPGFNFKRYYEAGRSRQSLNALVGLTLVKNIDLQLSYALGRDDYRHSDYGLKRDDFTTYGADLSYALSGGATVYGYYMHELYDADQASRQSGATFSTDPMNDWTANLKDAVDTIGSGMTFVLIKKKLTLDLSASYSKTKGSSLLYSPPGGTPNEAINFDKPLDTTTWKTYRTKLMWKALKNVSLLMGYYYEQYDLDDIVRNDMAVDFAPLGAIYLGALEPGYKYHVGFLKFVYSW